MKNFIFLGLAALIVSCGTKTKETAADNRIEITPFIVSQVIIQDTTQERTDSGKVAAPKVEVASTEWISEKQFAQFEKAVWALVKDPKSKVYVQLTSATPSTKEEVLSRIIDCDSVQQSTFDAQGNEILTSMWNCDSVSAVLGIRMIRFCESWYFNPETNMMEKEILGYSLLTYVPSKQAFKPLFYVYRDEEAYKTAKKNDFY